MSSNFRHWRNLEFGTYFQDDWKVSKRLTLNLGLRYDLFTRHPRKITWRPPSFPDRAQIWPSRFETPMFQRGRPVRSAARYTIALPQIYRWFRSQASADPVASPPPAVSGQGDHNDFGPRVGFAWDVFGNGKTALRGGFGVSYEGTLYNPLSNSRWNLPYYSFDEILGGNAGGAGVTGNDIVYGPSVCDGPHFAGDSNCHQAPTVPVTFTLGLGPTPTKDLPDNRRLLAT